MIRPRRIVIFAFFYFYFFLIFKLLYMGEFFLLWRYLYNSDQSIGSKKELMIFLKNLENLNLNALIPDFRFNFKNLLV